MLKIPDYPAFYKQTLEPSEYWSAGRTIENKNYELLIENHEEYDYPIDGWNYYVTPPKEFLDWVEANNPVDPPEIE